MRIGMMSTVRRAACVAACAALALTVTGCEGGKKNRGGGSDSDSSTQQESKPKVMKLGETAPEPQEFDGSDKSKAKFEVTPKKVVMGKAGDLADLKDQKTAKGKVPAWVYVNFKQVEGKPVKEPSLMSDIGAKAGSAQAKRLIMIMGELKAAPKNCVDEDDVKWARGKAATVCQVYLVPEGKKIDEVLLSRGFTAEPLRWTVN